MDAPQASVQPAGGASEPELTGREGAMPWSLEEGAMLWSMEEALERQTLQIGVSACGATAVLDVVRLLGAEEGVAKEEDANSCVRTRLRRNESPLPDYLLSRSDAGATHAQLITGASELSGGRVVGRFFHHHPRRSVRLGPWLAGWIRKGAVPVATMNMQAAVPAGEEVPDAWHHQLIFGVAPGGAVFMANPLDVVSESELHKRLCTESVLLIRREDVLQRLSLPCHQFNLSEGFEDPRWKTMDVEGQVRQMVLEEEQGSRSKATHIAIPAAYSSGVTIFALQNSSLGSELLAAPELQLF